MDLNNFMFVFLRPACFEDVTPKEDNQNKDTKDNQYQIVNRFDNFGGGWGYSGHSVEAIRFSADTDVMICEFRFKHFKLVLFIFLLFQMVLVCMAEEENTLANSNFMIWAAMVVVMKKKELL